MVAPFLGGHWSVVVPPVVSASPMRHWAYATLDPALYRPEILLYWLVVGPPVVGASPMRRWPMLP